MPTVSIELASALQGSTRARLAELGIDKTDSHCLILWISSQTSDKTTSSSQANLVAQGIYDDLKNLPASITAIYQTTADKHSTTPAVWEKVDTPSFKTQGPFFVRYDFQFTDDSSRPAVLSSLPTPPTLAAIETAGYKADVPC